jgi:hypothetical protein
MFISVLIISELENIITAYTKTTVGLLNTNVIISADISAQIFNVFKIPTMF